ncbi:MAG TPA: hypothetical protein DCQ14_05585, partial [Firmicutes bacterium]|nr:hypothetical protein [Bacillota bacterium]
PAALNVFLYGIFNQTAQVSYYLFKTPAGWVNMAGITALDMAHFASYIGFTLAGIIFLLHWGLTAQERTKRKIALLIGCSIILALIIGTLTEHLLSALFRINFPQLGPTVIMIPALVMLYCIRRYALMRQIPEDMHTARNQMLSGYVQARLFFYLAMSAFFGSIVGFMVLFFENHASLTVTLILCAVPAVAGIILYAATNLNLKIEHKDIIAGVVMAAILPVLTVLVYEYTTVHLWNLPIIFVLFAIVFSNIKIIVLTGAAVLFSLIWAWIQTPVLLLIFTRVDHAIRMVI